MLTLSDPTRPIRVFDGVRKMMGGQDGVEEGGRGMREMLDKWDDWRVGRRVQSRKRLLRVGAQIGLTTKVRR